MWTVEAQTGYKVNFTFYGRFDIEPSAGCQYDYVMVEELVDDQWRQVGERHCGLTLPPPIVASTHIARLIFRSNEAVNGDGFNFAYFLACGDTFTAVSGTITSPNWPQMYDNGLHCEYLISRPNDYITLEFEQFTLEVK